MVRPRIRTVLIDDSAFMRKVIGDMLKSDDTIDLVGVANNGQDGTQMALTLKPDVVVTDMVMPDYDGVYVVNAVMEKHPVPIILLSSLEKTDTRIFDALQHGAFEFIDKPTDIHRLDHGQYKLLDLIKQASRTDISRLKGKQKAKQNANHHSFDQTHYEIVVIGASTGGPGAVEYIINNLPKNLALPVIIVQHMPARFLETFSQRLNENSPLTVRLARKGETLKGGIVYLAPGDANMRIDKSHLTGAPMVVFTEKQFKEYNHPSVDCLFESVAEKYGPQAIGVILTGMGKDGTQGMKKIREAGGFTIGQDEASCVVYGMPKAAFESGAVRQVVALKEIPGFIVSCL
ncbi:chemotaxis-specific protein-glutamate methyltransferase CheB [Chryseolinea lacunae]|uniref:Protein-glutamate methylesterase/protein-glutamine glutaminase n=1 Tax=Chryseolinea lacunae TaxID=2801331 RepID=A0ABS1KNT8_9BACT|nr:chemotaxis-specific protein-glutamate methyltransferase CheB [Chryseolinea lacunae]MBL0741101.1 chemotaxis-specific protein-glutamate methyltransferase CheB [Chryseolinea lacunae]